MKSKAGAGPQAVAARCSARSGHEPARMAQNAAVQLKFYHNRGGNSRCHGQIAQQLIFGDGAGAEAGQDLDVQGFSVTVG